VSSDSWPPWNSMCLQAKKIRPMSSQNESSAILLYKALTCIIQEAKIYGFTTEQNLYEERGKKKRGRNEN